MTKARPPLTIENALFQVVGKIGIERAAEVTKRSADYIRSLSDPDNRYRLTVEDAIALDLEHQAQGGQGAPIYETFGRLLDVAAAGRFSHLYTLAHCAISIVKEAGEAGSAVFAAAMPGADAKARALALKELEDLAQACTTAFPHLTPQA